MAGLLSWFWIVLYSPNVSYVYRVDPADSEDQWEKRIEWECEMTIRFVNEIA